ncbi:germin-like protein 5 [Actinidia rufa]|uniref:Germin-like protein 5 n=1 Tax=Actinidia rufa TaxID=165716 RepID=A0A7J0ET92_9ERIC|nr:germin-like protein 5 [Actinidia rufa]
MAAARLYLVVVMVVSAIISNPVSADPDMLQDVCVADPTSGVKMNGFACKASFNASDFSSLMGWPTQGSPTTQWAQRGLVHFQKNNGKDPAAVIAGFNSQLPGTQAIAATLFTASPPVPDNVLTIAFQITTEEVEKIKSNLAPKS